jgi:hypothetical protein
VQVGTEGNGGCQMFKVLDYPHVRHPVFGKHPCRSLGIVSILSNSCAMQFLDRARYAIKLRNQP